MKARVTYKFADRDNTIAVGIYLTLWQRIKLLFQKTIEVKYHPLTYFELAEAVLMDYNFKSVIFLKPDEKVYGKVEKLSIDMASGRFTISLRRALEEAEKLGGNYEIFLELRPTQKVGYLLLKEQLH